jgi:hypothetical protein
MQYPAIMSSNTKDILAWDFYPTYSAYVTMMQDFHTNYPSLCHLDTIGTTTDGRLLLVLKISDNPDVDEDEPDFLYTSSMHGDEITGYVLMLRMIDYLLTNYGTIPSIGALVNDAEIWINPNANPDGTYAGGNNTVSGATRGNANNIDINRNFPDPTAGPHPDGEAWQVETIAWMAFMRSHNFVMSGSFHGGIEVMNYPWDTYPQLHADDNWLQLICHEYADTVQSISATHFTAYDDGITNGYAWYEVDGGRQDFTTYYCHGREVTIEISNAGTPSAAQLPNYWNWNYKSLLNYMEQVNYGIHGIVTDSITGAPLRAFVQVLSHDADSSQIYSNALNGDYHRLIAAGSWTLRFSATGYITKTITNVAAQNYQKTILDVQLARPMTGIENADAANNMVVLWPNPFTDLVTLEVNAETAGNIDVAISDASGRQVLQKTFLNVSASKQQIRLDVSSLPAGVYSCEIQFSDKVIVKKMVKK